MNGISTAPTLVREVAKGPVIGETPSSQDAAVPSTGSITNFGTPQEDPQGDAKRLEEIRTSIQHAVSGWTPAGPIENILTPPANKQK